MAVYFESVARACRAARAAEREGNLESFRHFRQYEEFCADQVTDLREDGICLLIHK